MTFLSVMNAKIGFPDDLMQPGYIFEPKLDGFRALCYVDRSIRFISRNHIDITKRFTAFDFRKYIKAKTAILDGELIAVDEQGRVDFSLVQQSIATHYIVFDIVMKNGQSLIKKPLLERKKILDRTVVNRGGIEKIVFTTHGKQLWHLMKKMKFEGVMAKEKDGLYHPGKRSGTWRKIKFLNTIDCVIVGYSSGKRLISSLALGLYKGKELHYIGNVGTGFNQDNSDALYVKLKKLHTNRPLIVNKDDVLPATQWVKPRLVAEVKYVEMTSNHMLRTSVFLRVRFDKKARECTFKDQI